jgi:hypothetical protein
MRRRYHHQVSTPSASPAHLNHIGGGFLNFPKITGSAVCSWLARLARCASVMLQMMFYFLPRCSWSLVIHISIITTIGVACLLLALDRHNPSSNFWLNATRQGLCKIFNWPRKRGEPERTALLGNQQYHTITLHLTKSRLRPSSKNLWWVSSLLVLCPTVEPAPPTNRHPPCISVVWRATT